MTSRVGRRVLHALGVPPRHAAQALGRARISREQIELLEAMREANRSARSPFRASEIWAGLGRRFEEWFWWEGIEAVESQRMNNFFSSPHPGDRKLLRYACWTFYQLLRDRDSHGLLAKAPATAPPNSGLCFAFDGRPVCWDQLISIDTFYAIAEVLPAVLSEPVVIVDLGAGWGRMGYVFKRANPRCTYVICDLPEALLVSSTYLPRLLPGEAVHGFAATRRGPINRPALARGGLFFLGTQDLERLSRKSVDVLINIASFQEMSAAQVDQYFELVDEKTSGVFYTQQLLSSQTHAYNLGEIGGLEGYPFRRHWTRLYCRRPRFSDLYFEAAYAIA